MEALYALGIPPFLTTYSSSLSRGNAGTSPPCSCCGEAFTAERDKCTISLPNGRSGS